MNYSDQNHTIKKQVNSGIEIRQKPSKMLICDRFLTEPSVGLCRREKENRQEFARMS